MESGTKGVEDSSLPRPPFLVSETFSLPAGGSYNIEGLEVCHGKQGGSGLPFHLLHLALAVDQVSIDGDARKATQSWPTSRGMGRPLPLIIGQPHFNGWAPDVCPHAHK